MKHLKTLSLLILASNLVACASITTGQQQSVSVTTNIPGATCELSNDDGKWYVNSTPGSVTVSRSYSAMAVNCNKDKLSGSTSVASSTKAMAFGNIIAGGIIGAAVDCGTGSAYDYPTPINVVIK